MIEKTHTALVLLEKGAYVKALVALDELANIDDSSRARAIQLYKTHRALMLKRAEAWADEVSNWASEHLLTPQKIIDEDIWQQMVQFEQEHDVKIENGYVSPKINEAQSIIEEEKQVRPFGIKKEEILLIKKLLLDVFFERAYSENSKSEDRGRVSDSEKIKLIRASYKKEVAFFQDHFATYRDIFIDARNYINQKNAR